MAKLSLSPLANLQNQGVAVTAINNNSDAISAAVENTLSRDGTTPNTMSADLDMNSNDVLNVGTIGAVLVDAETVEAGDLQADTAEVTTAVIETLTVNGSLTLGPSSPGAIQGPTGPPGSVGATGPAGSQGPAGATGSAGSSGTNGTNGTNGQGVPTGGTTGQVLSKINNTDYNTQWSTIGSGSVTSVSVASSNGFAGTSSGGATPTLTLSTSVTGILKGNGTAIVGATVGSDYSVGTGSLTTGILKSTTTTGALSIAISGTDYEVPLTFSTGLTRSTNTITVNTSQNIATISNLTSNGIVTTSGGGGSLSVTATTGSGSVVLATSPTITTPVVSGLLDASGGTSGQIKFPSTQNASANANTLDDYQEVSFTPVYSATGCTFSYASVAGRATKIGNFVYAEFYLNLNTTGNTLAANALTITGLPFTTAAVPAITLVGGTFGWSNLATSYVYVACTFFQSTTVMNIIGLTAASANSITSTVLASTFLSATAGSSLRGIFVYRTD